VPNGFEETGGTGIGGWNDVDVAAAGVYVPPKPKGPPPPPLPAVGNEKDDSAACGTLPGNEKDGGAA